MRYPEDCFQYDIRMRIIVMSSMFQTDPGNMQEGSMSCGVPPSLICRLSTLAVYCVPITRTVGWQLQKQSIPQPRYAHLSAIYVTGSFVLPHHLIGEWKGGFEEKQRAPLPNLQKRMQLHNGAKRTQRMFRKWKARHRKTSTVSNALKRKHPQASSMRLNI
jgi:hypothetical protein